MSINITIIKLQNVYKVIKMNSLMGVIRQLQDVREM